MTTDTDQQPYVLQRDEGSHHHFLGNLATTKVTAGDAGALCAVEFLAPRGFGPPLHRHDHEDEIVVVIDGEVAFRSGDDETIGTAGSTAFLPRMVPHTFQVLSDSARMLSITGATSGVPVFDRMVEALGVPTDEPVLPDDAEIDAGHVAEVSASFGIAILGPPPAPLA